MSDVEALVVWYGEVLDREERKHRKVTDGSQNSWEWFQGSESESESEQALREIEAKRRILDEWVAERDGPDLVAQGVLGFVIRAFAATVADRPGYREEWRP